MILLSEELPLKRKMQQCLFGLDSALSFLIAFTAEEWLVGWPFCYSVVAGAVLVVLRA